MLNDWDSLFEKYAIMSFQEDVTKEELLNYLHEHTTEELFNRLLKEIH